MQFVDEFELYTEYKYLDFPRLAANQHETAQAGDQIQFHKPNFTPIMDIIAIFFITIRGNKKHLFTILFSQLILFIYLTALNNTMLYSY